MRRNFFLLNFLLNKKTGNYVSPVSCHKTISVLLVFFFTCILLPVTYSQLPVPGIKANGSILNGGDTMQVCVGSSILYVNTGQNYSSISWRFKNGNPVTSTNPVSVNVLYNSAGLDSTVQTLISGNDTATMFVFVKVNNQYPVAAYTFSPDNECGNIPVNFNSSGSSGVSSYLWDFNDGGSSTAINPTYQFLNAVGLLGSQQYRVKLKVSNSLNCSDSVTQTVTIKKVPDASLGNADANVIFADFNGVKTFRRCENIGTYLFKFLNLTTTSSINTKYTIKWGDSSPDSVFTSWPSGIVISHPYSIGQRELTLTVEGSNGCIGIKKYNVFLGTTPAGGFASLGNTSICAPNTLKFVITGYQSNPTGTTYKFSVNDGSSFVTYNNPPPDTVAHLFSVGSCGNTSSNGTQTFANSYRASLDVENPCGSTSVSVIPIYVSGKPKANMTISPSQNVCTGYSIFFGNTTLYGGTITPTGSGNSTCANSGKQVWTISPSTGYSYSGSLGSTNNSPLNGLLWTSGSASINVNFNIAGTYTIKLFVGNDLCGIDSITRTVCVRNPPQASFTMNKKSSCGIDTAIITNTSPVGGCLGDNYSWNVAYSDPTNCSTGSGAAPTFVNGTNSTSKNANIRFANPGRYVITLTVNGTGTSFTCSPAVVRDTFYVKAKPKAKINTVNAICVGNTISPSATVTNCYAENPLTYAWTFANGSPASSALLSPGAVSYNITGNHQIVLDVANECGVTSDTAYALITSKPSANAGRDTAICSGVPVKIGANSIPGYIYQWTPATGISSTTSANPTLTATYNGPNADTSLTYIVTASAGANCSGNDTVSVTVKKKPVVMVTPSSAQVCVGSGAQLIAKGANAYVWTPVTGLNSTTGDTVIASPGNNTVYTVTGTMNGCSSTATASVTLVSFPVVSAGADTTVCNTTAIQLKGTPAGGVWSGSTFINAAGVFNANTAGNGIYTLAYTALNGNCSNTDSVIVTVINPPVANAGADTSICQSIAAIQLNGVPAGGKWSGSTFVTTSGKFLPSTAGTYQLIYSIGGGTCTANDTIVVNVAGGLTNNSLSANQAICTGTPAAIIIGQAATGGNGLPSYQWQLSVDSISWADIPGATAKDYSPGILTQTTFFRRIASTSLCSGLQSNASNIVKVTFNPNAKAEFNPTITKGCVPFIITPSIINLTTANGSVSEYRWYVNGTYIGSGQQFPGYTISNTGDSITIKLVAVSRFGCKNDTTEHGFVTVERPEPSFIPDDTAGCGPLVVAFTNTTPNASRYNFVWNFGQGQTSTLQQPGAITFPTNPANTDTVYRVTMQVISSCDTITRSASIRVKSKPKALFTPDRSEGCSPMSVTFSNTSRGNNASYIWDFGDGSAPLASNAATVQHTFTVGTRQTFYVKLKAANECGADSLTYAIVVSPNSIRIDFAVNGNELAGCAPHTVHFINNTTGANSFHWDFGDGTALNTSKGIDTVAHTYTTAGNFSIALRAASACNDTTDAESITVALKPNISFTASPLVSCITDLIHINNTSDSAVVNAWKFGDGTVSSARNPVKAYSKPGNYRIWLTGSNVLPTGLSCSDSAYADLIIRDTLPGNLVVSDSVGGCIPFRVTFKNASIPASETTWIFGDGSTATGDSTTHIYTAGGIYNVVMISRGSGGCIFKSSKTIRVTPPAGTLIYNGGFVCQGTPAKFEIRATNTQQYRFIFGDGDSVTTSNPVIFHQYTKPGKYLPYAYLLSGPCLIKISTGDSLKIENIHAGFRVTSQYNCGSTDVQFSDTSYAYFGLKSWQWNFGDGSSSAVINPTKTFTQSGSFYVHLNVTGQSGCADSLTVPVTINVRKYPVSSIGADSTGCTGQSLAANALVLTQDSVARYNWTFGNNSTGSGRNTSTVYNNAGVYTIRLITATVYGCADTAYKTVRISISPIVNAGTDVRICKGQSVQLSAFGAPTWQWSPLQNLSCNTCANPVANPPLSTQYLVKGTNAFGCSVTDTVLVEVVQPVDLTVSANDTICIGEKTQLFASGATNYSWNPVAGLSSGTVANPVANPTVTTRYQVIGSDSYKCFADTAYVIVAVGPYPTVDLGTGALVVAGTAVTMNPVFANGPFRNYAWTPVDNLSCNNCPRPVATINNNIVYRLEVENLYGCKAADTISYSVKCEEATQLYVPNAFSPDNDGLNDVLMVRGRGLSTVKYFRIFNRWGQLVFERSNFNANDANQGWDGTVNGKPGNPDVYVYTAEVVCTAGGVFVKKGNVTLFR